jgi:hypothetical protein
MKKFLIILQFNPLLSVPAGHPRTRNNHELHTKKVIIRKSITRTSLARDIQESMIGYLIYELTKPKTVDPVFTANLEQHVIKVNQKFRAKLQG